MTTPTGEQYELRSGPYRAVVVQIGGGLRALTYGGREVLDGYHADQSVEGGRGQLLAPWPNRIDHGRYRFGGKDHQLELTEPARDNAIHGLVRREPWRLVEHGTASATLAHELRESPGYPYAVDFRVDYSLHADTGLTVRMTAANVGDVVAPYGFGAHPYLTVGTRSIDHCELVLPAAVRMLTDERGLPAGREPVSGTSWDFRTHRQIGATRLDDPYTDLTRDDGGQARAVLRDPKSGAASTLWLDRSCRWVQVYTGDTLPSRQREGLAVEPMTCPPNAFVSGEDLVVVQPSAKHTTTWGVSAS